MQTLTTLQTSVSQAIDEYQAGPAEDLIRVLLVEDHALVRGAVRALLEEHSQIRVIGEAESAPEALEFLEKNATDVVITDVRLKASSGVDLTASIEKLCPNTKTLILTGYPYEQYLRASVRAGAEGYVLKEASRDELLQAVCDVYHDQLVFPQDLPGNVHRFGSGVGTLIASPKTKSLSLREIEVLEFLDLSFSPAEIATRLGLSRKTVYTYVAHIHCKLGRNPLRETVSEGLLGKAPPP